MSEYKLVGNCPVCSMQSTYFHNNVQQIKVCVACGYKVNQFSNFVYNQEYKNIAFPSNIVSNLDILYKINEEAQKYFQKKLKQSKSAQDYLAKRNFNTADIVKFGFGYADGYLSAYLKSKGYDEADIERTGLIKKDYDYFRFRVTIPIKDINGRILGFGARTLMDVKPKYLNTPETEIFKKKNILFGLNSLDSTKGSAILCEGYMDAIMLQKEGFNAIAGMGTALTSSQIDIIKSLNLSIFTGYDCDDAGEKATLKNMHNLQMAGISCQWIDMKPCKDPDAFLKQFGKEEMQKRIIQSKTRFQMVMQKCQFDTTDIREFCEGISRQYHINASN